MSYRVNCLTTSCKDCKKSYKAGKRFFFGSQLYTCSAIPKKHKEIEAIRCSKFECAICNQDYTMCRLCSNCSSN